MACASTTTKAFKFRPVSDLLFVLRALSGLYWILRGLGARVRITSILQLHGVRLDGRERAGRPGI